MSVSDELALLRAQNAHLRAALGCAGVDDAMSMRSAMVDLQTAVITLEQERVRLSAEVKELTAALERTEMRHRAGREANLARGANSKGRSFALCALLLQAQRIVMFRADWTAAERRAWGREVAERLAAASEAGVFRGA